MKQRGKKYKEKKKRKNLGEGWQIGNECKEYFEPQLP